MRAVLLALLLAGCTEPRSAECKEVCKREAECVAACAALEHDSDNAAKVKRHVDCVHKQQSCAAVLECK